ncbi:MAG: hypothetical protein ACXVG9_10445 [Terriglobales bacterium]
MPPTDLAASSTLGRPGSTFASQFLRFLVPGASRSRPGDPICPAARLIIYLKRGMLFATVIAYYQHSPTDAPSVSPMNIYRLKELREHWFAAGISLPVAAKLLSAVLMLTLYTPSYAGLFGNFIDCQDDGYTTRQLAAKGATFSGQYGCWKGSGAFRGRGTLTMTDGSYVKATNWFGQYDSAAVPEIEINAEIESYDGKGQLDRYMKHGTWLYEVPSYKPVLVTGRSHLLYTRLDDGRDQWQLLIGEHVLYRQWGPEGVTHLAIPCAGVPRGLVMVGGKCVNDAPDGKVELATPDGLREHELNFEGGKPTGVMNMRILQLSSTTLDDGEKPFFRNIVRPETSNERDVLSLKRLIVAVGRPEIQANGALEFAELSKYAEYDWSGIFNFDGAGTINGYAIGDGHCSRVAYDLTTRQRRETISFDREPCRVRGSEYLSRSDKAYRDRVNAQYAEMQEAQAESARVSAENFARFQADRAQTHAENQRNPVNIGQYIQEKGAEMSAQLRATDKQIVAGLARAEQLRAQQIAEQKAASRTGSEAEERRSHTPGPSRTTGMNSADASSSQVERRISSPGKAGAEIVLNKTDPRTQSGGPAVSDVELDPVKAAEKYMSSHPGPTDAGYSAELALPKKIVREGKSTSLRYSETEARADLEKIKAVLPQNIGYENSSHLRYVKFLGFVSESCQVVNKVQYICNVQYDIEVANKPSRAGGTISK